jgi:hypothetical protein
VKPCKENEITKGANFATKNMKNNIRARYEFELVPNILGWSLESPPTPGFGSIIFTGSRHLIRFSPQTGAEMGLGLVKILFEKFHFSGLASGLGSGLASGLGLGFGLGSGLGSGLGNSLGVQ